MGDFVKTQFAEPQPMFIYLLCLEQVIICTNFTYDVDPSRPKAHPETLCSHASHISSKQESLETGAFWYRG